MSTSRLFYTNLKVYKEPLSHLFDNSFNFENVPEDWHVVVVDIEKSTQAVKYELHHPVNFAASLAISAVLNELNLIDAKVDIPYFFGGDGTTFLIPDFCAQRIYLVLENIKYDIYEQYFLTLRVGTIKVYELRENKTCRLKITKFQLTEHLTVPVVIGDGLESAETIIKNKFANDSVDPRQDMYVDTSGCKCRWAEVRLNDDLKQVLCFIVKIVNRQDELDIFKQISSALDNIFGNYNERIPLDLSSLEDSDSIYDIHNEINEYYDTASFLDKISLSISTISRDLYKNSEVGKTFLKRLRASSLAFLIDGSYNDIVQGNQKQIQLFIKFMENLELQGAVLFGYHITDSVLMSCYILEPKDTFVQLLDASEGGYSTASKMLKIKQKIILD